MIDELQRMQSELLARMRELRAGPADPRIAPLVDQMQALVRERVAAATAGGSLRPQNLATLFAPQCAPAPKPFEIAWNGPCGEAVRAYAAAARPRTPFEQAKGLNDCKEGKTLLALSPADRMAVAVHGYGMWCAERDGGTDGAAWRRLVGDLLRGKSDLSEDQALSLVKSAVRQGFAHASYSPNQAVAGALKRHVDANGLSAALKDALAGLQSRMKLAGADTNAEGRKLLTAVEKMLGAATPSAAGTPVFEPKPDAWGRALKERLIGLDPALRARVVGLLVLAAEGGGSAKPGKTWLKAARGKLEGAEREALGAALLDVLELYEPGDRLEQANQDTLRAVVWLVALAASAGAARRLEVYAQKCLTFSSAHFAYLNLVLGNATVLAFSLLPGTDGAGSLARLRRRLKRPGEIKTVDKALAALAAERGMSASELEEIGLPDFGFAQGRTLEISIGPATAILSIDEEHALDIVWCGANGELQKSVPAAVKDAHAAELKELKARTKEIDETLKAQRLRIERLYLSERTWPLAVWKSRYHDELLVSGLSRRLIWSFEVGGRWVSAIAHRDGFEDAAGEPLDITSIARVRLWHPMQSSPGHVVAWRRRLRELAVTQPFKQAHREVYLLTDAERATETYSNRFAGHIVDQHHFRALAMARGWNCPAFGGWDPGNGRPLKRLPGRDMQVEFWVEPIEDSMQEGSFQFDHLATDQVRFTTLGGEAMPLERVDPVLFSELMRDCDLFVGVAGIASDPTWIDRGEAAHAGYWGRAAFGELTESGKTRHDVLKDLLPGLAIAGRCRLEERYLVVEGRIRTYRIHLGSGNIQMEPNSQYLCIVQDRQAKGASVRLPFEGDMTLSIILSKAFMLAEDDKIKDRSIRSQILGPAAS